MPRLIESFGDEMVTGLSVQQDFAFVRMIQAIQDFHQRAFARAIFAQQGMNLTRLHIKVHMIVGKHAGKSLCNAHAFQGCQYGICRKGDCLIRS